MEQKRKYVEEAIDRRWWLAFAHDDRVLAARVKRDAGRIVLDETIGTPSEVGNRL